MRDDEALVRAIAEHPDEDTPRLALADWLDERGGESNVARAEFIRIQVELTRHPDDPLVVAELQRREAELWVEHRRAWRSVVPDVPGVNWRGFDRGFLTVIDVDLMNQFVRHAALLFSAAPVQAVRILGANPVVTDQLATLPELIRLRELDLTALRAPRRRRSRALSVGVLTDTDAALLARAPGAANLRVLRLGGNRIGDVGLRALAASPFLRNLCRLDVTGAETDIRPSAAGLADLRRALPNTDIR
jgi:uncharacterized protein (TIGR02996 family)